MKSLYNAQHNGEIIARINALTPGSERKWGTMTVSQMLAHCNKPFEQVFGKAKLKRSIAGILFGSFAKKMITNDKPFKEGLPTDKEFVIKDEKDFDHERENLIDNVRKFGETGGKGLTDEPHPFFGKMSVEEWDMLFYKHLDHHLRQFGV